MNLITTPVEDVQTQFAGVFDRPDFADDSPHEQVVFCHDERSGLKAVISIHSTALGPALGGTRFYPYPDEQSALTDVLRLSRGMTYKAAIAGLDLGGGKAVIIGDPTKIKTRQLLMAYGRFVETLGGRYITAADVGTTAEDMNIIGESTSHVVSRTAAHGGSGDSAPLTALGVFRSMTAAAEHLWGSDNLDDRTVAVEGAGKVGYNLVRLLVGAGASVLVNDVDSGALDRIRDEFPSVGIRNQVIDAAVDIYAPCAMGATLNDATVPTLNARLVCGAANNQLARPEIEQQLTERGITWVPDFVANSGGLIQVAGEIDKLTREQITSRVVAVGETVTQILDRQRDRGVLAGEAAHDIVQERMADIAHPR